MKVFIAGVLYAAGLAFLVPGLLPDKHPIWLFVWSGGALILGGIGVTVAASPIPRRAYVAYWRWRGIPMSSVTLSEIVKRSPQNPELPQEIQFTTNARTPQVWRVSETGNLPTRISFVNPEAKTIYRTQGLPAEIKCKLGTIRVSSFVVGGFVLDERGCKGDFVRVEVYFD